jgi:sugar transferase (PEP-CTERM/EpsH1 system associated)
MADILFIAHRIPFPPDRGDKMRSFHMLRHLAGLGRVHLACFADDQADAAHLTGLRAALDGRLGEALVEVRPTNRIRALAALVGGRPLSTALFESPSMRGFVQAMLASRSVDAIFVFSGQMAQFVPERPGARFVMDFGDVDSAKFEDYGRGGRGPIAWLHRREGARLAAFEREVARRADFSLFVSEAEAALFRRRIGSIAADVRALGNGIDLDFYDPNSAFPRLEPSERSPGPLIAFTGQMDYRPNVEAVTAFSQDVMPRILQAAPTAKFAIVGRRPTPAVRQLAGGNGTIVTGAVADVRSWLDAADVVVAPLRIARGVQNKLLEAMAMARPVVASGAAFEGIDAVAGRDLLVADGAEAQTEAILHLIQHPVRAAELAAAGRRRMEQAYGWEARLEPLAGLVGLGARRAAA